MPPAKINYRSLVLVGIGLPALVALADAYVLSLVNGAKLSPFAIAALFAFYVGQVYLLSWSVARFIANWPLRWIILVWAMVLLDLQLAVMMGQDIYATRQATTCLGTAMLAGQFGACVVWGLMGSSPIVWRVPALIVLALLCGNFFFVLVRVGMNHPWMQLSWNDLLLVQEVVLAAVCGVVRLAGFALKVPSNEELAVAGVSGNRSLQFGIRDVLIGTTSLAALLGLAKAGDMLTWEFAQQAYATGFLLVALIALTTAAVMLVALWAALGQGPALMRGMLLILFSLAASFPLVWYCINVGIPRMRVSPDYRFYHWYATAYWWIGWMFLAATLLAASLIVFRTLGYRLVRSRAVKRGRVAVLSKAVAAHGEALAAAD